MTTRRRSILVYTLVCLSGLFALPFFIRWFAANRLEYGTFPNAGPVQFTEYTEQIPWQGIATERFTMKLPPKWRIGPPIAKGGVHLQTDFEIYDPSDKAVLKVWTEQGRHRYLACLCTSKFDYQFSKVDGIRIWYWKGDRGERTFKCASTKFSTDIHGAIFRDDIQPYDEKMLCYLIESIRPRK